MQQLSGSRYVTSKVPEIAVMFWVIKVLTTGVGESTSDFLVRDFDPVISVLVVAILFAICVAIQFTARRFVAWRYWLLVTMISIFGTMVADVTHIVIGVPYAVSSVLFALVLTVVFVVWSKAEGTLSIHSILTPRREVFYWLTVGCTFALGTAVGDLTATTLGFGYWASALLFAVLIALPGLAYRFGGLGPIASFWAAYVLTRPLGASIADGLAVSHARGGLALGTAQVSVVGLVLIAVLVAVTRLVPAQRSRRRARLDTAAE